MPESKLFTIGFAGKSAANFFELLESSGAKGLIDIRLNRNSQLSGFAKEADLEFFLQNILNLDYEIQENLAPSKELLESYRKGRLSWLQYERDYLDLLERREVFKNIDSSKFRNRVLLCSEALPEMCHRRLVAEQLSKLDDSLQVIHLV
ncbi:MAG: DUF488 domain-containing protein [Actinobacteria bacterium]|nr:DUF488 domain-containing protein [Actinomycetota bacterium]